MGWGGGIRLFMMMIGKRRVGWKGMVNEWPWSGRLRGEIQMTHVKFAGESGKKGVDGKHAESSIVGISECLFPESKCSKA